MTLTLPDGYPEPFGLQAYEAKPLYQAARDRAIEQRKQSTTETRDAATAVLTGKLSRIIDGLKSKCILLYEFSATDQTRTREYRGESLDGDLRFTLNIFDNQTEAE